MDDEDKRQLLKRSHTLLDELTKKRAQIAKSLFSAENTAYYGSHVKSAKQVIKLSSELLIISGELKEVSEILYDRWDIIL